MAHLTNYTFSKLCRKLNINQEIDLDLFLIKVFNDPKVFRIFNKYEVKYLFNYKQLLEDFEGFSKNYFIEVPEKEDSKRLVFEKGGKLKYHLNNECELINNNFIDFNIPPEITNLGDKIVDEFREWFKFKGYAEAYFNHQLDLSKLVFDYNIKFPKQYNLPVLNEGYKLITEISNSNNKETEDAFDYNTFLIKIEHLVKKHENTFSCKTTRILCKFDHLMNKSDAEIKSKISELLSDQFIDNYGMDKLKNLFKEAKNMKYEIITEILNYFKFTYKLKEKNFENITLEKFGLVCCGGCKKNY